MYLNRKRIFYFVIKVHRGEAKEWYGFNGYCISGAFDTARNRIRGKYFKKFIDVDRVEFQTLKEIEIDDYGIFI